MSLSLQAARVGLCLKKLEGYLPTILNPGILLFRRVWLKIKQGGLRRFSPCFHLPGFHFGTGFEPQLGNHQQTQ